jgi:hypothetical protein
MLASRWSFCENEPFPDNFQRPYAAAQEVLVWLSGFEMGKESNWWVGAFASDATVTGFTIYIDTWHDTVLRSARTTWISFPSNRPNIASGS